MNSIYSEKFKLLFHDILDHNNSVPENKQLSKKLFYEILERNINAPENE